MATIKKTIDKLGRLLVKWSTAKIKVDKLEYEIAKLLFSLPDEEVKKRVPSESYEKHLRIKEVLKNDS